MYKIEKNVELPTPNQATSRYPFKDMVVGDSFVAPLVDRASISSSSKMYGDRQEPVWKFMTRKINATDVRVWRVQ